MTKTNHFEVLNHVIAHVETTPARKLVLTIIAKYANADGIAWPSIETIALCANVSVRYARSCIRELEDEGSLSVERRSVGAGHTNQSNIYQIRYPACDCEPGKTGYINHQPKRPATEEGTSTDD